MRSDFPFFVECRRKEKKANAPSWRKGYSEEKKRNAVRGRSYLRCTEMNARSRPRSISNYLGLGCMDGGFTVDYVAVAARGRDRQGPSELTNEIDYF